MICNLSVGLSNVKMGMNQYETNVILYMRILVNLDKCKSLNVI